MFFTHKAFWTATAERAAKSFGQGALVAVGGNVASAWSLDYLEIAGVGLGMAVASVLTSLASAKVGDEGPSLGGETLTRKVAAVEAPPAEHATEFVAGPAADVPEGTPVEVVEAAHIWRHDSAVKAPEAIDADPFLQGNGAEDYQTPDKEH